jgi:hypothetical protein
MKKVIIILIFCVFISSNVNSQKWENYFQFAIGTGYMIDANIDDTPLLLFEYGKSYKWLDVVTALEYAHFRNDFLSLVLKTKFDFIRMFTENSRHSLKLGVGVGVGTTMFMWYDIPDNNLQHSVNYILSSAMASYEYAIANKTSLGIFFNNYISFDTFLGLYYVGLSIRRNF